MTRTRAALAALALVAGCSSGGGGVKADGSVTATGPASAQQARLSMTDRLRFSPNVVHAQVGTLTLVISNTGVIPHNLTFDDHALGRTDTVQGGATATLKVVFPRTGTYRFVCTFHSGMSGQVVVTEARS